MHVTLVKGGKGETPESAVQSAVHQAMGAVIGTPRLKGNPAETIDVKGIAVVPRDENPMIPTNGKRWYEAVIVASFPLSPEKKDRKPRLIR